MADVAAGEHNLLTSKVGRIPVWLLAVGGLLAAWLYAKWRDSKASAAAGSGSASDSAGTDAASESQQVAPQFIIENNMPNMPQDAGAPSAPSAPVTTSPAPAPVATPPGTSPSPPSTAKPAPAKPPAKKAPAKKAPLQYKVRHGDNLSTIAAAHHTTWQKLWAYNTTPGNRPAATIRTLKQRGPSLLYAGETILIPQ